MKVYPETDFGGFDAPAEAHKGDTDYNGDLRIFDLLGRDVTADNGSLKGVYVVRTEEGVKRVVVK